MNYSILECLELSQFRFFFVIINSLLVIMCAYMNKDHVILSINDIIQLYCKWTMASWRWPRLPKNVPSFQTWQLSTNHMGSVVLLSCAPLFAQQQLTFSPISEQSMRIFHLDFSQIFFLRLDEKESSNNPPK